MNLAKRIIEIYEKITLNVNGKVPAAVLSVSAGKLIIFSLAACFSVSVSYTAGIRAQADLSSDTRTMRIESISYPVPDSDLNSLHIYFSAPYQSFYFVKPDSFYHSKYQVSFNIADSKSAFYKTEIVNGEITLTDFSETKSKISQIRHHIQLSAPAGHFVVDVQIEDLESSRSISEQYNIEIPENKNNPVAVSNPLFVKSRFMEEEVPDFFSRDDIIISDFSDSVYIYLYCYRKNPAERASLEWKILKKNDKEELMAEGKEEVSSPETIMPVPLVISGGNISSGEHRLDIKLISGSQSTEGSHDFSIIWRNEPVSSYDISSAAEMMEYILPKNQFDVLRNKKGDDKKEYFLSLWKEKDPNPDTDKNELMEEYFFRAEYANLKFQTSFSDGWKTDRGRIFILLGPPDRIKRRYKEFDSPPYEIWEYTALARNYYFADKDNRGDFKLVSIRE